MRGVGMIVIAGALAAGLAGCGQKSEAPVMPEPTPAASETPAAEPAGPTPEELHEQQEMLAKLPAPYNTADLENGQRQFGLCRSCHTIAKGGANMTGPDLYGVFGTKAAEVPGFDFSDAMKASGLTWDAPTLDTWLANPAALVPNTKMTFLGVKDAKNRQDIVAYIATQRDD